MHEPLSPRNLTLAYNATEDRLIIIATNEDGLELGLLFTRRLTERLVNGLAATLEKSSTKVARAPAEWRDEVVLLEHQGAITVPPSGGEEGSLVPERRKRSRGKLPAALITGLNIKPHPRHFEVVIKSGEKAVVQFRANRKDLHRILDMLKAKAQDANWDIKVRASWLDPVPSGFTVN